MEKLLFALLLAFVAGSALGAERKAIKDVDSDALMSDTQSTPVGAGDKHMAIVWWVPIEFWQSQIARESTTSDHDKKSLIDAISGISLVAIVQSDISSLGSFDFYSRDEIEKNLVVTYTDSTGEKNTLKPLQSIRPDLVVVLGVLQPMLSAAAGNMGKNFQFFVLDDKNQLNEKSRLIDPYQRGILNIQLKKRDKGLVTTVIEMPLNSLFIPRKCPNGKDARISWNFCPWDGTPLKN